jgi:peptidoglycan/xylan/chitin deacetylase (PgdA/CDA1 family)
VISTQLKAVARKAGLRCVGVARVRARWERGLLAAMPRLSSPPSAGRILCYHGVGTASWGINDVTPARFRRHLELAHQLGYRFVPAAHIARGFSSERDIAITFDDGLASVGTNAASILAEFDIPWTLFVVSDWASGNHGFDGGLLMTWREVERLAASGVEIGSHSVSHPDFGMLPAEEAKLELLESRRVIEARIGIKTTAFAIPMGQSGNWTEQAQSAAMDAGYEFVYAQSVDRRPRGTVPRAFIAGSDDSRVFKAALEGAFDGWEEWV